MLIFLFFFLVLYLVSFNFYFFLSLRGNFVSKIGSNIIDRLGLLLGLRLSDFRFFILFRNVSYSFFNNFLLVFFRNI